jgi:DNA polymerase-3 subunit epsilon
MLKRTIITFDLETTGVNTEKDQICQYYFHKNTPDGETKILTDLVKPTIPIPAEASAVTGITDETVKDAKSFKQLAPSILDFIGSGEDLVIAGYNSIGYDVPLLVNEFVRNGIDAKFIYGVPQIDGMVLYRNYRNHKLVSAVKDLCGYDLEGAHDAGNDVEGTRDVLRCFHQDPNMILPDQDLTGLDQEETLQLMISNSRDPNAVDFAGKLIKNEEGIVVYNMGKDKGKSVITYPGFAEWMLMKDFPQQTKYVIRKLLKRQ